MGKPLSQHLYDSLTPWSFIKEVRGRVPDTGYKPGTLVVQTRELYYGDFVRDDLALPR